MEEQRENSSTPSSLKQFLSYLKPYTWLVALAAFLGIVRYLIPLVMPWILKILVDSYLSPGSTLPHKEVHILMAGLCALYILYGLISYLRSYLSGLCGHNVIFDLRQKLYLHVQQMSLSFFDRNKIGSVVAHMTSDIAAAQNFVGSALINTAMDLSCVSAIVILLFCVHWKLALVSLSVIPFYAALNHLLTKQIKAKSREIHDQLQEISGDLHEQFAGISTIQAFNQQEAEAHEFRKQNEKYRDAIMDNLKLQSAALGLTGFLTSIGPVLVLWYGAVEVWNKNLSVGTLMAFYAYLGMLFQPVQRLTELNIILVNSLAAMDRIFSVFDIYPEVREAPKPLNIGRAKGNLCFQDVFFTYDKDRGPVLSGLSLDIPAGKTVALVGPSGAGKSTLVKLLPRFYDVTEGRITIDGRDIRDLSLKSLRQQFAIVAQEPILFSGDIIENLRYGKPNATEKEIHAAAEAAFAADFIAKLPLGYKTQLGERGLRLSGGQRQRLAIARAFLKDAPFVLLDEPTSALDAESEELIKKALKRMMEGRTAIIIAHRLSTIQHADIVVVIDQGKIVEQGRHEELLNSKSGIYRRYAEQQLFSQLLNSTRNQ